MMWAIFSKSQPQSTAIKNSFKQIFLNQQLSRVENLHSLAKNFHQNISNLLKVSIQSSYKGQQKDTNKKNIRENQIIQYSMITAIEALDKVLILLMKNNEEYMITFQMRDLQKQNDHIFFKQTMINYDNKRKQLKQYLFRLQNYVQQRQIQTTQLTHRNYITLRQTQTNPNLNCQLTKKSQEILNNRLKIQGNLQKLVQQRLNIKTQNHQKIINYPSQDIYIPLAKSILIKDNELKNILTKKLQNCRLRSHTLSQYNNQLKQSILKWQHKTKDKYNQQIIRISIQEAKRSVCISYLKQQNKRINRLFQEGIGLKYKKRSKSCLVALKFQSSQQKEVDLKTQEIQKRNETYGDITMSFNQHLQYIISEKFVQQDDL